MADKPSEPAQPPRNDGSTNYIASAFFTVVAILGLRAYFGAIEPNDAWVSAGIILALLIAGPVLFNLIGGKPLKRLVWSLVWSLYFGGLMTLAFLSIVSTGVEMQYRQAQVMSTFAAQDFDAVDSAHTGLITSTQLDAIDTSQDRTYWDAQRLHSLQDLIDQSSLSEQAKSAAKHPIAAAEADLRKQLLPEEQRQRIFTVSRGIYIAGHPIAKTAADDSQGQPYAASKEELSGFQARFEMKYALWLSVIRTVKGWIGGWFF